MLLIYSYLTVSISVLNFLCSGIFFDLVKPLKGICNVCASFFYEQISLFIWRHQWDSGLKIKSVEMNWFFKTWVHSCLFVSNQVHLSVLLWRARHLRWHCTVLLWSLYQHLPVVVSKFSIAVSAPPYLQLYQSDVLKHIHSNEASRFLQNGGLLCTKKSNANHLVHLHRVFWSLRWLSFPILPIAIVLSWWNLSCRGTWFLQMTGTNPSAQWSCKSGGNKTNILIHEECCFHNLEIWNSISYAFFVWLIDAEELGFNLGVWRSN